MSRLAPDRGRRWGTCDTESHPDAPVRHECTDTTVDEASPGKAAGAGASGRASGDKAGGGNMNSSISPSGVMRSGDISTSAANVRSSAKLGGAGEEGGSGTPSFSGAMTSKAALQ